MAHRQVALRYPMVRVTGRDAELLAESVTAVLDQGDHLTADGHRALGSSLARLGRLPDALAQFDSACDSNPADLLSAQNQGIVLTELSRNGAAVRRLAPLAASRDATKSVLAAYSEALARLGKDREAADVCRRALARWRNDPWFLARLAACAGSAGEDSGALERLKRSATQRGDVRTRLQLGLELLEEGHDAEALEMSEDLIRRSRHSGVRLFRARALARSGMADEAVATLSDLLDSFPSDSALRSSAAFVLRDVGRPNDAVVESGRAAELSPLDGRALATHALMLDGAGQTTEAIEFLDRAIALDASDVRLYVLKAGMLHESGRIQEAFEAVEVGLRHDSEGFGLLDRKAMVLVDLRRPDEALLACEALLAQEPDDSDALATHSQALLMLGRADEALAAAVRSVASEPANFRGHLAKGDALLTVGRSSEALSSFDRCYEIKPSELVAQRQAAAAAKGVER